MRHKKIILSVVIMLLAVIGILLSVMHSANAPDRMLLNILEIPIKAQKYTLAGEGGNWRVECDRYDGIILKNGRKTLLQEITLTLDYKGSPEAVKENAAVNFSMEEDSILIDHLRQVEGADTLVSSDGEYSTIWYSASGYAEGAPADQLPGREETLSIAITVDGKTEVVALEATEPN